MDPNLTAPLTNFSLRFGNELKKQRSCVSSPLAAQALLALTALGSGGDTRAQLLQALGLRPAPHQRDDEAILSIFAFVTSTLRSVEGISLKMGSKVYLTNQGQLKMDIVKAAESFGPVLEQLNFANNVGAANIINTWVAKQTGNTVKHVISPGALSSETRMLLVNATFFQGYWEQPFMKSNTRGRTFHVNNSTEIMVPMMSRNATFYPYMHSAKLNAQILQIHCSDNQKNMVLILPDEVEGLGAVLKKLAVFDLETELAGLASTMLDVTIPRFRVQTEINLKEILRKMGITSMFVDQNSDIRMLSSNERLFASHAIQKTMVVVEEGEIGYIQTSSPNKNTAPSAQRFVANRPFLFLVNVRQIPVIFGIYEGSEFGVMPSHSLMMPAAGNVLAYSARVRERARRRRIFLFVLAIIIILSGGTVFLRARRF